MARTQIEEEKHHMTIGLHVLSTKYQFMLQLM